MNEPMELVASGIFGALLGLVFFWGLWSTLKGLERSPRPALRLMVSFLLRTSMVIVGFYFIVRHGGWVHVSIAVSGFVLSRIFVGQRLKSHCPAGSRLDDNQS